MGHALKGNGNKENKFQENYRKTNSLITMKMKLISGVPMFKEEIFLKEPLDPVIKQLKI